jgi:hypothetical protein
MQLILSLQHKSNGGGKGRTLKVEREKIREIKGRRPTGLAWRGGKEQSQISLLSRS